MLDVGHDLTKESRGRQLPGLCLGHLSAVSAVRLKVAQLSHKGLRTVVTEVVKQVLWVLKKLENRTKAKKNKSLVQGAEGISKISLGSRQSGVELLMRQNFLEPASLFSKQS